MFYGSQQNYKLLQIFSTIFTDEMRSEYTVFPKNEKHSFNENEETYLVSSFIAHKSDSSFKSTSTYGILFDPHKKRF